MNLTWLEISKSALQNNVAQIRKQLPKQTKFIAVVKANAYGHGLFEVVNSLKNKVDYFAVYDFADALLLRKKKILTPLITLGRLLPQQIDLAIKNKIEVTVSTFDVLQAAKKISGSKKLAVHICVDTGLGRDGFIFSDAEKILTLLKNKNLELRGIYAHFAAADDAAFDSYSKKQVNELLKWKKLFNDNGFEPLVHHAASAGSFNSDFTKHFDMVRIGYSIYGLYPSKEIEVRCKNKINLKPVLSWNALISEVKSLPKGSAISYGCTHILKRDSKIAVLPIGYFDGMFRGSSNKGWVLVNGIKVPQLGRITMNIAVIDVTDVKNVKAGDVARIIGCDKKQSVTVEDWATWANTSGYEITTRINAGLVRKVV